MSHHPRGSESEFQPDLCKTPIWALRKVAKTHFEFEVKEKANRLLPADEAPSVGCESGFQPELCKTPIWALRKIGTNSC
jgi:hypothetical protein